MLTLIAWSFDMTIAPSLLSVLSTSLVLTWAACSPGPAPVSQSPRDPSSPAAAEGVSPLVLASNAAASASAPGRDPGSNRAPGHEHHGAPGTPSAPGHEHHGAHNTGEHAHHRAHSSPSGGDPSSADAGAAETVYVCPMHPEVTAKKQDRCSKCGMNLVPKK